MDENIFYDGEFIGYIQELVDLKKIDGKATGIAQLAIDKGYSCLSEKQKFVFEKAIEPFYIESCARCGSDMPFPEMADALDNGGLCGYCANVWDKIKGE